MLHNEGMETDLVICIAEKGEHEKKTHLRHTNAEEKGGDYAITLALTLAVLVAANVYFVSQSNAAIDSKIKYAADLAKPATLQITKISADCPDCFDVTQIISAIKQLKVNVTETEIESTSSKAKELIEKYNITRIPTLVVTGDAAKSGLDKAWGSVGTQEGDGALVLRIGSPFINPESGKVIGKAEVVLLNYSACPACYDVAVHKEILKRYGVVISRASVVDAASAEGKALAAKYNITKVPTAIISPEAEYYDALRGVWKQVGSVETDGWYVFRNMEAMQKAAYYDLTLSKVVNPTV